MMVNSPGRCMIKLQAWEGSGAWNWFTHGCGGNWAGVHSFIHKRESNQLFLSTTCKALAGKSQRRSVGDSYGRQTFWLPEGWSDLRTLFSHSLLHPCSTLCSSLEHTHREQLRALPHPSKICLWADRCSRVTKPRHPDSRP